MTKRVVFLITDPSERENVRTGVAAQEDGWDKIVTGSLEEAVTAVQAAPVEAVVVEHRRGDPSGSKLLDWVLEHCPEAARLIVAEPAEREEILRAVSASHQFLPRPVTPEILKGTIQGARLLDAAMPNEVLFTLAERIKVFPPLPSLYFRVLNELGSPNYSSQTVAEIVSRDLAMTTRLLQVINSGFYGLPRRITDLTEAVNLLGQETVKSLIVGIQLFLEHDHIKPLYFSIHQLWQHSNSVAHAARLITQMETGDRERADEAYTAGLLHDLGKLVLANNFETQHNKVQQIARDSRRPLWEVEAEEFGVSHAELGAFILGRWGMPVELLEATAFHHRPGWRGGLEFSTLTAVHVANVIEHELRAPPHGMVASALDLPYIDSIGLMGRIDSWKDCIREGKAPARSKSAPLPPTGKVSAAGGRTMTTKAGSRSKAALVMAGVAAVGAALGILLWSRGSSDKTTPIRAKSRATAGAGNEGVSNETHQANPSSSVGDTAPSPLIDSPAIAPERE
jgi:HD-like signal output (HDOD) protein